ncbi:MAG TPA: glycosyltransferase [Candidatus Dormibacteraeota bacterium]|nr:glycosyltransferase [Candidatus Dormibacteraeota bacterium]
MRNALLLSYYFPPEPEAGALRAGYMKKYLSELGWNVDVVSRELAGCQSTADVVRVRDRLSPSKARTVVASPNVPKRSFAGAILRESAGFLCFPDRQVGWLPAATSAATRLIGRRQYHALLSTGPPHSAHLAAALLSKRFRIPWVADYRDLWTGNPYQNVIRSGPLSAVLERTVMRYASSISIVAPALQDTLKRLLPAASIHVIPNGPDVVAEAPIESSAPTAFTICYTGLLYNGKRCPDPLFAAIRQLRDRQHAAGRLVTTDFYGPDEIYIRERAQAFDVADCVNASGIIPRDEVVRKQRQAAVLLILLNMDPRTAGEFGSKIFEYISARRPILAIGPANSVLRPLLQESGIGLFAADACACADALVQLYEGYQSGRHEFVQNPQWKPFDARQMARAFAGLLDSASTAAIRET